MVKQNRLSVNDAIAVLRSCVASGLTIDLALMKCDNVQQAERNSIRIGDLLSLTGLISDIDLLDAIETSLARGVMVGELLIERKRISLYILHCALELQQMLFCRIINLHQAREFLLTVNDGKGTLEQCVSSSEKFCKDVLSLLVDAYVVSLDEIAAATELGGIRPIDLAELLFDQGFIERTQLDVARRCVRMVDDNFIPREQALQVLSAYASAGSGQSSEVTQVNEVLT